MKGDDSVSVNFSLCVIRGFVTIGMRTRFRERLYLCKVKGGHALITAFVSLHNW